MDYKAKSINDGWEKDFHYAQYFIEMVKCMWEEGKISQYKAVQMLDEERKNFGNYKEYFDENRIKIIDSLF